MSNLAPIRTLALWLPVVLVVVVGCVAGHGHAVDTHVPPVKLTILGEPEFKGGEDILAIARSTTFVERGALSRELVNGRATWIPALPDPHFVARCMAEGAMGFKLVVEGRPGAFPALDPGTYFFFVQSVAGTWRGDFVDDSGAVVVTTDRLEVKQELTIGVVHEHETPRIAFHPHGDQEGEQSWISTTMECESVGTGPGWMSCKICVIALP